jgi:hypothetical protein
MAFAGMIGFKGANQGDREGDGRIVPGSIKQHNTGRGGASRRKAGSMKGRRSVVGANGGEGRITATVPPIGLPVEAVALTVRSCHKVTPADSFA